MKKISLLVFTLSITISAQEGWFQQNEPVNSKTLNTVEFINDSVGFAAGWNGTIFNNEWRDEVGKQFL